MYAHATRPRTEIDDRYQWRSTLVYESPEAFERAFRGAHSLAEALRTDLEAANHADREADPVRDPETLADVLERFEDLLARTQRLVLFATLERTADLADDDARARRDRVRSFEADVASVKTALRGLLRDRADRITTLRAESDRLEPYARYLEDAARLPEGADGLEPFLARFDDVFRTHDRILTAVSDEDFEPPTVEGPDGDPVEVQVTRRRQLLKHPDRAFRRRVYEACFDALEARANAIATTVVEKARTRARLAEARGFDSVREAALNKESYPETGLHVALPTDVHDVLCETVSANLEPFHRLAGRRRAVHGLSELRPWDVDLPLTRVDEPTIPYDEACEYVLAAVEPLGSAYRERLESVLAARRVDVYPAADKREVTYCLSAADTGAFVSLWYDGSVRSLFHFAHELGHAMEVAIRSDARRPLYATTPRPVEEVPSILHELLLADHLLAVGDEPLREHVRSRLLTTIGGNLYDATRSARFTHELSRAVEGGEPLSRDRLDGIHRELYEEFHPAVVPDDRTPSEWLAWSHAREPYHNYQYALGITAALVVADRLREGRLDPETYREFLEVGGTRRSLEQFRSLGVDVTEPDPYERAVERFAARR